MAKQKVVIRGELYDDVVFMGYGVKADASQNEYTFTKFTLRYPHSTAPDWVLLSSSADVWISNQAMLRKDEPRIKSLEGSVLLADRPLTGQITVTVDQLADVMSDETLAATIAALEAKLAARATK
jgi:hypothetical protein